MSESSSAASQVGALINRGKFRKAARLTRDMLRNNPRLANDADFMFQFALAEILTGDRQNSVQEIWESTKFCKGYTRTMEGDFCRDLALAELRHGNLEQAETALGKAREIHAGDTNRMAAITMVEGRIAYANRDYKTATMLHGRAASAWHKLGDQANKQWIKNNVFHQLRSMAAGNRHDNSSKLELYQRISRYDESRNHRVGAWLAYRLGRFGNSIYDKLARLLG